MFRCKVCGWLHLGATPPDTCPSCGSPADRFRPVSGGLGDPGDDDDSTDIRSIPDAAARLRLLAVVRGSSVSPFARTTGPRLAVATGDAAWYDNNIPCMRACPVNTDVASYIGHVAGGAFALADLINREQNLFAGTLGRTCARPCEDACRRTVVDAPIRIRALKRVAADNTPPGPAPKLDGDAPAPVADGAPRIAVVGAGVAGLTAARDLAVAGLSVTIFERDAEPGGPMVTGVPAWRLPRDVVATDIASVVASGVRIVSGTAISGSATTLSDLAARFDAVILATGTQRARTLTLDRSDPASLLGDYPAVIDGLSWLRAATADRPIPEGPTVVIGSGYTAIDCARTARRLTAAPVSLLARAATASADIEAELAAAIAEGIDVLRPVIPTTLLAGPAGSGLAYLNDAGSPRELACATVVVAIGQEPDPSPFGSDYGFEGEWLQPDRRVNGWTNVWAAGDLATGATSFIDAIADARTIARRVLAELRPSAAAPPAGATIRPLTPPTEPGLEWIGAAERPVEPQWTVATLERRLAGDPYVTTPQQTLPVVAIDDRRLASGDATREVETGLDPAAGTLEASRCLQCQANIEIDADRCILCNGCVDACPYGCIEIIALDRIGLLDGSPLQPGQDGALAALVIDEDSCTRCGRCVDWCPTACITMPTHRTTIAGSSDASLIRMLAGRN